MFIGRLKNFYLNKTAKVHRSPIFTLGFPKSGTTVIAALLAKISGQEVTIDPIHKIDPSFHLQRKLFDGKLSLDTFIQSHKYHFSTPLNKDPQLTFLFDQLQNCFPTSKFIFVIRDPRDTLRSFLNRRTIPGDLVDLSRSVEENSVPIGRFPTVPGRNYIERLAHRWNLAVDTYIKNKNDVSSILYEDFMADKVETIRNLSEEVGLKARFDISDYVDIQYQPRGDRDIKWTDFFGTRNLLLIETICCKRMAVLGYQPLGLS